MKTPFSRLNLSFILPAALLLGNCAPQPGVSSAQRSPMSAGVEFYRSLGNAGQHPLPADAETTIPTEADLMPPVVVTATRDPGGTLDDWPSCKAMAELNVARVLATPTPPPPVAPDSPLHGWLRSLR